MSRVALYIRISLEIQDQASQRHALESWLSAHPEVSDPLWLAETISGAARHRPEFERLMSMVESGEVGHVVVFSLDRLGRTMSERLVTMARFADTDCVLESVTEGLADHSEEGMFMGAMRAYVAAVERRRIKQRTSAGIRARIAGGQRWGGSMHSPTAIRGRRKLTDAQERAAVARVRSGERINAVAASVGVPRSTLGGIVRRVGGVDTMTGE